MHYACASDTYRSRILGIYLLHTIWTKVTQRVSLATQRIFDDKPGSQTSDRSTFCGFSLPVFLKSQLQLRLLDAKLINNCRSARPLRVSAFKTSTPSSGCLYPLGLGPDFPLEPPLGSPRVPTRCAEYLGSRSSGSQIGRPAPPGPLNLTESAAPDWLEGWFVVIGSSSPVSARYHFWGLGTGLSALSGMR